MQNGVFRFDFLQDLLDEELIEGVVFGLLALRNLADKHASLFLPEGDVEVVVDQFDLDVGLFFDSQQVLDVGLVEEGDVGALLARSARSSRSMDVGFRVFRW